jgi:hypothetical protein
MDRKRFWSTVSTGVAAAAAAAAAWFGVVGVFGLVGSNGAASSVSFDGVNATAESTGEYAFSHVIDGRPATWDVCRPVRVMLSSSVVDAGLDDEARQAMADIAAAGRFVLVDAGVVDMLPSTSWGAQSVSVGADVIVSVDVEASNDVLNGSPATTKTFVGVVDGFPKILSAVVVVDRNFLGDYRSGMGPRSVGALLTHELLHAVGLGHVSDPTSVITSRVSDGSGMIGPGDRAGLAALAFSAPCSPST